MKTAGHRTARRLAAIAATALPLLTLGFSTAQAANAAVPQAPQQGQTLVAPYVDLGATASDLGAIKAAGVNTITAAFVSGPCNSGEGDSNTAYFAGSPDADAVAMQKINSYLASGGTVIPSFGGYIADSWGCNISQTATDLPHVIAADQKVIDETHATTVDYDIEGALQYDTTHLAIDAQAFKVLQQKNPGLQVTLTLPATNSGDATTLTAAARGAYEIFASAGVKITRLNAMAMDYGAWNYQTYGTDMLKNAELVAEGVHDFLKDQPQNAGAPDAQVWSQVGIVQLIGAQDVDSVSSPYQSLATNPQFSLQDAAGLRTYALAKGLGEISIWSSTKDRPAPVGWTYAQWAAQSSQYAWLGRTDGQPQQFAPYGFEKALLGTA